MSNLAYNQFTGTPAGWPLAPTRDIPEQGRWGKSSYQNQFSSSYGVYNSFTGADIVAYIHIPSQGSIVDQVGITQQIPPVVGVLGNIQTISYSTFREVNPVRSLGKIAADSYTRGPRTIAGTIVWTVLDQYVLAQALKYSGIDSVYNIGSVLIDQIPPFNIIITMSNEYGDVASMGLYGIRVVNEGSTYSIDDMITEQTNTFVAKDMDLLHKGPPFKNPVSSLGNKSGTDILMAQLQSQLRNNGSF